MTLLKLRGVHRSKLDHLTACTSPSPILPAYYPLGEKSKHSETLFDEWNSRFLLLSDNMITFIDASGEQKITPVRQQSEGCT